MSMRAVYALLPALALPACGGGGGGGSDPDENQGVFIDSPVAGVQYSTPTRSGLTDTNGTFVYLDGERVSFHVGDILLGSAPGSARVTPIDFVPGAGDETHPTVTNILRFVQTLDEDGDPSNGIVITPALFSLARGASVDFAQSAMDFENDGNVQTLVATLTAALGSARMLIDAASAQQHLRESIGTGGPGPGPGPGPGTGNFGRVDFSGPDAGALGTPFVPAFGVPGGGMPVSNAVWTSGTPSVATSISVLFGTARSVTLIHATPGASYSYVVTCFLTPEDCTGLSVDIAARTVTFEALQLPVSAVSGNSASAPIVVNGVLNWP